VQRQLYIAIKQVTNGARGTGTSMRSKCPSFLGVSCQFHVMLKNSLWRDQATAYFDILFTGGAAASGTAVSSLVVRARVG
jgi:hypothetical protein